MITAEVQLVLNIALKEAVRLRHEYILCEHILYCISHQDYGTNILKSAGVDVKALQTTLEQYLETQFHRVNPDTADYTPSTSVALERVINQAIEHCTSSSQENCDIDDILIAMLQEKDSYAVHLLYKYGLERYELLKIASYDTEEDTATHYKKSRTAQSEPKEKESVLKKYARSLNDLARQNQIDPLIGREEELEKILAIFSRRKKNNPILVGEPGVGKTAIVEGLALKITKGDIHPFFKNFEIYSIDMASLLAGTRFRGDFEERIKQLFQILKDKERIIVFIDEIHTIIGSGTAGNSQLDTANLLKPFLATGKTRFIGATTYSEYRAQFQKDQALSRRFEKVDIHEPSQAEALMILNRLKSRYEHYHNIVYPQRSLKKIIDLSQLYLKEKKLPDSAIDVLDISGAMVKLKHFAKIKPPVTTQHIEKAVSRLANVPLKKIDRKEKDSIRTLEINLKKEIYGQDHAISKVVRAIKLSKSLLGEASKPIASFLFTGPTGVGKTELSHTLTRLMHIKLIRLDMSEYMEAHSISKLIGPPPGYVGYNDFNNQLTEQIRKHPHSLLLLDEIEKAHSDVLNIFLQVMDYGTLTNSNSNKIDFSNIIIVMTSNAGADELASPLIGFVENDPNFKAQSKINKIFSPEFRNRLDAIVHFNFLSKALAEKITRKFIHEINLKLKPKKITLTLTKKAIDYLIKKGFDKKMGARPLKRVIEKEIKEKLIDHILFGKLMKGGDVHFDVVDKELSYTLDAHSPTQTPHNYKK